MERDMRFAEQVAAQAQGLGLETIHVYGIEGIDALAARIAARFGLEASK
jgi:hypothetical protein